MGKRNWGMITLFVLLICLTLAGCGGGGSGPTPTVLLSEDFSSFSPGAFSSPNWSSTGSANIVEEASDKLLGFLGGGDIAYTGTGSSGWTNYTLSLKFKITDYTNDVVEVEVRHHPGAEPGFASYTIWISAGHMKIMKNSTTFGGSYGSIATDVAVSYVIDTFYNLKITVNGANIKVYFDNASTPDINFTDDGSTYDAVIPDGTIRITNSFGIVVYDDIRVTTP